jgi:hypothetical protein
VLGTLNLARHVAIGLRSGRCLRRLWLALRIRLVHCSLIHPFVRPLAGGGEIGGGQAGIIGTSRVVHRCASRGSGSFESSRSSNSAR